MLSGGLVVAMFAAVAGMACFVAVRLWQASRPARPASPASPAQPGAPGPAQDSPDA
jgi:Flp pilus assembly protein CpaB